MNTLPDRLAAIFEEVIDEARNNSRFAARLERALVGEMRPRPTIDKSSAELSHTSPRRSNRRAKAAINPFEFLPAGEHHLRAELAKLGIDQLKDVVAEYGMDTSRLALKWKSQERLIEFIITTALARHRKGDVFRDNSMNKTEAEPAGSGEPPTPSS